MKNIIKHYRAGEDIRASRKYPQLVFLADDVSIHHLKPEHVIPMQSNVKTFTILLKR